jgi:hypothetical protein
MPNESHALVRLAVGSGGELELVMAKEIWEALKKVVKEEEAAATAAAAKEPFVRVSLKRMTVATLNVTGGPILDQPPGPPTNLNVMELPPSDNPPCPPVGFSVTAMPGSDNPPCPPLGI